MFKKIVFSTTLICALNLHAGFFSDDKATFDELYPTPFYKTTSGMWVIGSIAAVGLTAATIVTGGVAAVPGATWIGGLMGGTWTAGLATLGGGTLASGGFGMAGGAMVFGVTTDLALVGLTSFAPSTNYQGKYSTLKIPLPEVGSTNVLKIFNMIDDTKEQYEDGDIGKDTYGKIMYSYYNDALRKIDKNNYYDLINKAILEYNLGQFKESLESINEAEGNFKEKSYIFYHKALLSLATTTSTKDAITYLEKSLEHENNKLKPYILLAQIHLDNKKLNNAFYTVSAGLKHYDDDSFELNWLAGMIKFELGEYHDAIKYYKTALSNMSINKLESECKVMIANSYYYITDYEEAKDWYNSALDEVEDTNYVNNIREMYRGFKL